MCFTVHLVFPVRKGASKHLPTRSLCCFAKRKIEADLAGPTAGMPGVPGPGGPGGRGAQRRMQGLRLSWSVQKPPAPCQRAALQGHPPLID